jgi:hypothetical protein
MNLYTHSRPPREAIFIKEHITADKWTQECLLYYVDELGIVAVHRIPENNKYYNIGNRAYWIAE